MNVSRISVNTWPGNVITLYELDIRSQLFYPTHIITIAVLLSQTKTKE